MVNDAPATQNIISGDDVDVGKLPAPFYYPEDGGRYIGTAVYLVAEDPDTGWTNLGTYRMQVQGKDTVSVMILNGKHGEMIRRKWEARGEKMPCAAVIGCDPVLFLTSSTFSGAHVSEYDMAGAVRQRPINVFESDLTGLKLPATAEFILEGYLDTDNPRVEGPFGEYTGYYSSAKDIKGSALEPVIKVQRIYHRDNPIIMGCPPQRPPDEMCRYRSVTRSAMLRANIERAGVPDVTAAWMHEVGNSRMLVAVSIKQRYAGHAKQAGHIAATCHVGGFCGRYVVVVDDDIDISNLEELIWAMITRSDPATSIDIIADAWSSPLDPRIPPEKREVGNFTSSRAIIDACRPYHWRDEFAKVNAMAPELMRKVEEKFGYLLEGKDKPD